MNQISMPPVPDRRNFPELKPPPGIHTATAIDTAPGTDTAPTRWGLSIALAAPLIVLNCIWIACVEVKDAGTGLTMPSLFMGVTFILFLITVVNLGVRAHFPRFSLHQGEMLTLYIMLTVSSVVAGVGNFGFFLPYLTTPFWTDSYSRFTPLLPAWFGPRDKAAILKPFYNGHSSIFHWVFLRAWAPSLAFWGVFFVVLIWTMLCAAAIIRRQWADNEHLSFPIILLPVEMTRTDGGLYRNRLLWIGFCVPAVLHTFSSLNSLFPAIPCWPINHLQDLLRYVPGRPWNGVGPTFFGIHPAGVGLGFLVSTDMLFSSVFFLVLFKLVNVACVAAGWRTSPLGWFGLSAAQFPFWGYQSWGAWLAICVMALWMGRPYFREVFQKAWTRAYSPKDLQEPLTPRAAVFGILGGGIVLCGMGAAVGLPFWLAAAFLGFYFVVMITLSRIRADVAIPSSEPTWVTPQNMLTQVLGTSSFSHGELAGMALFTWFNTDYAAAPMPHQFEAFKAAQMARIRLRPVVTCILVAAIIALAAAYIADLQVYYVNGAASAKSSVWVMKEAAEPWRDLDGWWNTPRAPDPSAMLGMTAGVLITLLLAFLRIRWFGFPFHPAAYALNTSFIMEFYWADFVIAWICKSLILRYGGMRSYRAALPFFLGLILGDWVTGGAWSIVGAVLNQHMFETFPT